MMPKKHKRKCHYHTGSYESIKGGIVNYRSGWELLYAKYLDSDPTVTEFSYEQLNIAYLSNKKTGRIRHYIPDFMVTYIDGRVVLVEIKPLRRILNPTNVKKFAAAKEWAILHDVQFQILTERELRDLHIL